MLPDQYDKQPLESLLDTLYAEVYNVPSFIAKPRLLAACREFCRKSLYCRETVQTIPEPVAKGIYHVMLPENRYYAGKTVCYIANKKMDDSEFSSSAAGDQLEVYAPHDQAVRVVMD